MEIEKEIRYRVNNDIVEKIKKISKLINEQKTQKDIVLGCYSFETLEKCGFICRIREKNEILSMEVKKLMPNKSFEEYSIKIDNLNRGISFLRAMGMKPYLYIKKNREIREYKGLKICIDNVEMLGDFIEIEFQDCDNHKEIIKEFIENVGINGNQEPLYGDIFKKKILEDMKFKEELNNILKEFK